MSVLSAEGYLHILEKLNQEKKTSFQLVKIISEDILYCLRCGAQTKTKYKNNIGKCVQCDRIVEFVPFYPTLLNCIKNGYKDKVEWIGSEEWYRDYD